MDDVTAPTPDPSRFETGDWAFDPSVDPEWDDPKIRRLRLRDEEYKQVADAIVRGQTLEIDGHEVVREIEVGVDSWMFEFSVCYCILNLRSLYNAVKAHPEARLARAEEDEEGFHRPTGVFDQSGRKVESEPTAIGLHGCVVESCTISHIYVACVLGPAARFAGNALFVKTQFTAAARFEGARFGADARFEGARFGAAARFEGARFGAAARFDGARFGADAGFDGASFGADARFDGVVNFEDCHFSPQLGPRSCVTGDLRRVDARGARFLESPRSWKKPQEIPSLLRRALDRVGWTLVRSIGELSILTRLSVLAIILVPPIASAWPAIRAGIVGYNAAVADVSERFDKATAALREAEIARGDPDGSLDETITGIEGSLREWQARFGRMHIDDQNLPASLALAFFAAALVTIAQLLYQVRAPNLIRKHDEDGFVGWMHDRYAEGKQDRNDGLRRACDGLAAAARTRRGPMRNANFVMHHGEMVWIPPKERIDWFEDIGPDNWQGIEPDRAGGYPQGYLPGAERARIAIEEGAKAEYWLASREHLKSAWACALLYAVGLGLLLGILIVQGRGVWRAADFPWLW